MSLPNQHLIEPWDEWNQRLVYNVHPADWKNPEPKDKYHLVVIGAGTGGLVAAAGAAGLGAKVALVEKHLMGGDCLNVGCVPSKALIRAARAAWDVRRASRFGIRVPEVEIDFRAIMDRVRKIRSDISSHDSARRFTELGVDVFLGEGKFIDRDRVEAGGRTLKFKRAIIATGARATIPEIPGLEKFLTNETVFNLTELPKRLAVLGGGPMGCEMAQAFQRLGSQVTLFHNKARLLDKEDEDAAEVIENRFRSEGVALVLNTNIRSIQANGPHLIFADGKEGIGVDAILVSTGRTPNVAGLQLQNAGVDFDIRDGISVNDFLQTTNHNIYAVGDVCMKWKFTHAADAAARLALQNALFLGRKKLSSLVMPWVTYTDPEVAHVGLSAREAEAKGIAIDTFVQPFTKIDRAQTDGETEGFAKIVTRKGTGNIMGGTIVGRHAGEMAGELAVAICAGWGLGKLGNVIHPYPTQAEALKKCGDAYNRSRLTPGVRALLKKWLDWTG